MRSWVAVGAVNAFIAVAAGAFAAHGLKGKLEPHSMEVFETAARYQMYHALGLVLVGLFLARQPVSLASGAGWSMLAGIILFSGSLYALALTRISMLGAITPLGGVGFLAGWVLLAIAAMRAS